MKSWLTNGWNQLFQGFWTQVRAKREGRRSLQGSCVPNLVNLERLEERVVLSPFYSLSVVARTGVDYVAFGDLVSINNAGTVAFVGYHNDYDWGQCGS